MSSAPATENETSSHGGGNELGVVAVVSDRLPRREKGVFFETRSTKSLEANTTSSVSSAPRGQLVLAISGRRASERSFPMPLLKSVAAGATAARRTGLSQGFGLSSRPRTTGRAASESRPLLSMAMIIKIKMRLREIRMRIRSQRKKERDDRVARGDIRLANTYRMEPTPVERFRQGAVEAMLESLLRFWLADVSYQHKLAARVCGSLAEDALRKVKTQFRLPRYKLVAYVTIGSRSAPVGGQGDGRRSAAGRKASQTQGQSFTRKQSAATPEGRPATATTSPSGGQLVPFQRGSIAITSRCFGAAELDSFATATHISEDLFASLTLYAFYYE